MTGTVGPLRTAEVYDPAKGTWKATGLMLFATEAYHSATRLPTGRVLVAGGSSPDVGTPTKTTEIYTP